MTFQLEVVSNVWNFVSYNNYNNNSIQGVTEVSIYSIGGNLYIFRTKCLPKVYIIYIFLDSFRITLTMKRPWCTCIMSAVSSQVHHEWEK